MTTSSVGSLRAALLTLIAMAVVLSVSDRAWIGADGATSLAAKRAVDDLVADQTPLQVMSYRDGVLEMSDSQRRVMQFGAEAVPHLIRVLDAKVSEEAQMRSIETLGYMGSHALGAVSKLRTMARTATQGRLVAVMFALARIDGSGVETRSLLLERGRAGDVMAILALSEVPECVELVDVAAKALEDQLADGSFDSLLKSHTVARAVVQMKRGSKRMTAALVRGLRVGEHEIFGHALAASRADVAESDLLDLLGTGVRSTQVGAMIYIFRTARASESIRRAVRVLADDTDSEVRKAAIATLGELRDEAALPLVRKALDDSDWRVREIAAIALGSIGRPDAETISALKRHLSDTNARVQREVVNALAQLESPSSGK